MKKKVETYLEYRIKEINDILQFKNGEPVLGEKLRRVRISPQTAKTLNSNARNFGKVYVLQSDVKEPESSNEDTGLEQLREQAKELGVKGAHLMKEEKLQEKINEKLK